MKTKGNFVNLNVNPCKMCMPMGAAIAFKGIESAMMLLHGSQGCSTYIRRHMARHYNEPVDIASSSLSEHGTVYGGSANLKQGLKNVIKLYDPKIIGIATTCLAETIGEDIDMILQEFRAEEKILDKRFVPVATPGYGATQFEGYFATIKAVLEYLTEPTEPTEPNNSINIIVPNITPAEIRYIKQVLNLYEVTYNIIPDYSDTLDSPFVDSFRKLPPGGTSLLEVKRMAGAMASIEMSKMTEKSVSPGAYLNSEYRVPLYRCSIPTGLQNIDEFLRLLSSITGKDTPESLAKDRGRMLDAMIDSHKYNSEIRAAVFGEPESVYAAARLCIENGIFPALISTGSKTSKLQELLKEELTVFDEAPVILDDTDFETIRDKVKSLGINLLIGHSDGKFITERDGIPLVRYGYPITDRIGGQRLMFCGYEGSTMFLDLITNTYLEQKYSTYRSKMIDKYAIQQ